jgi:putative DNA-invertase from lambdoid prophage Rac
LNFSSLPLDDLHGRKVSVWAQTGLSFDLNTASGKLMRTIMAGLAEFERDLIRDERAAQIQAMPPKEAAVLAAMDRMAARMPGLVGAGHQGQHRSQ